MTNSVYMLPQDYEKIELFDIQVSVQDFMTDWDFRCKTDMSRVLGLPDGVLLDESCNMGGVSQEAARNMWAEYVKRRDSVVHLLDTGSCDTFDLYLIEHDFFQKKTLMYAPEVIADYLFLQESCAAGTQFMLTAESCMSLDRSFDLNRKIYELRLHLQSENKILMMDNRDPYTSLVDRLFLNTQYELVKSSSREHALRYEKGPMHLAKAFIARLLSGNMKWDGSGKSWDSNVYGLYNTSGYVNNQSEKSSLSLNTYSPDGVWYGVHKMVRTSLLAASFFSEMKKKYVKDYPQYSHILNEEDKQCVIGTPIMYHQMTRDERVILERKLWTFKLDLVIFDAADTMFYVGYNNGLTQLIRALNSHDLEVAVDLCFMLHYLIKVFKSRHLTVGLQYIRSLFTVHKNYSSVVEGYFLSLSLQGNSMTFDVNLGDIPMVKMVLNFLDSSAVNVVDNKEIKDLDDENEIGSKFLDLLEQDDTMFRYIYDIRMKGYERSDSMIRYDRAQDKLKELIEKCLVRRDGTPTICHIKRNKGMESDVSRYKGVSELCCDAHFVDALYDDRMEYVYTLIYQGKPLFECQSYQTEMSSEVSMTFNDINANVKLYLCKPDDLNYLKEGESIPYFRNRSIQYVLDVVHMYRVEGLSSLFFFQMLPEKFKEKIGIYVLDVPLYFFVAECRYKPGGRVYKNMGFRWGNFMVFDKYCFKVKT